MYSSAQICALSLADTHASKSIATLVKFTSLGLSLEFDIDILADKDEMLAILGSCGSLHWGWGIYRPRARVNHGGTC